VGIPPAVFADSSAGCAAGLLLVLWTVRFVIEKNDRTSARDAATNAAVVIRGEGVCIVFLLVVRFYGLSLNVWLDFVFAPFSVLHSYIQGAVLKQEVL
jgi:hypothetical protein